MLPRDEREPAPVRGEDRRGDEVVAAGDDAPLAVAQ
jgi:hypothetical protein